MFHSSLVNGLLITVLLTTAAAAQENPADSASQPAADAAAGDNPFRAWRLALEQQALKPQAGMDLGMGMEGGYGGVGIGMTGGEGYGMVAPGGAGGFPGAGGYSGAGGYAGGDYGQAASPSELFQKAVRDSVQRLAQAKTEAEKQQLLEAVRTAFHERYQQAIAQRQRELNRIEKQLQQLREDLERRRAAEQKVVEVQLRTIELAGEGLVQLGGN